MIWLSPPDTEKQSFTELRLYAPKEEKILLDFEPLKMPCEMNKDPLWEDWHCYCEPLRVYKQDYELLLPYIGKIYPTKDAVDGRENTYFDPCFENFIGKDDWSKIISEIEKDFDNFPDNEKIFFSDFIKWLKEALRHTSVIVVEGNL